MARLSDRGFTSTRGLSYTLADTATNVDAALPITHGLGALPSSLELWVEVSAGQWEQHDASTYVTASSTALTSTGTTLASVVGGATNVRLVAAAGAVAISVAEASASQAGIVSTGAQTFGGAKTFNDAVSSDASHLGGYGLLPVGAIVAYNPGYYTDGSNAGFASVGPAGNTVAQINAYLNGKGWYVCDGAAVNNAASPIWNAAGRYLPNLDDGRFLRGSTTAGTQGGAATTSIAHTHSVTSNVTVGNHTLTIANLPSHNHSIDHGHAASSNTDGSHSHTVTVTSDRLVAATPAQSIANTANNTFSAPGFVGHTWQANPSNLTSNGSTSTDGSHSHTITVNNHVGNSGPTGSGTAITHSVTNNEVTSGGASVSSVSIEPTYLNTFYIVRVF